MYRSRGMAGVPLGTVRGLLCFCATLAELVGWGNPLSILTLPPLVIPPLNLPLLRSPPGPFHEFISLARWGNSRIFAVEEVGGTG